MNNGVESELMIFIIGWKRISISNLFLLLKKLFYYIIQIMNDIVLLKNCYRRLL